MKTLKDLYSIGKLAVSDFYNLVSENKLASALIILLIGSNSLWLLFFTGAIQYLSISFLINKRLILRDTFLYCITAISFIVIISLVLILYYMSDGDTIPTPPNIADNIIVSMLSNILISCVTIYVFIMFALESSLPKIHRINIFKLIKLAAFSTNKAFLYLLVASMCALLTRLTNDYILFIPMVLSVTWVQRFVYGNPPKKKIREKKTKLVESHSV